MKRINKANSIFEKESFEILWQEEPLSFLHIIKPLLSKRKNILMKDSKGIEHRIRKSAHSNDNKNNELFVEGINRLIKNGIYGELVGIHSDIKFRFHQSYILHQPTIPTMASNIFTSV